MSALSRLNHRLSLSQHPGLVLVDLQVTLLDVINPHHFIFPP